MGIRAIRKDNLLREKMAVGFEVRVKDEETTVQWNSECVQGIRLILKKLGISRRNISAVVQAAEFIQSVDLSLFPANPRKILLVILRPGVEKFLTNPPLTYRSGIFAREPQGCYSIRVRRLSQMVSQRYREGYYSTLLLLFAKLRAQPAWLRWQRLTLGRGTTISKRLILQSLGIYAIRRRVQDCVLDLQKSHFGQPFKPVTAIEKEFAEIKQLLDGIEDPLEIDARIFGIWWLLNHSKILSEELPQILTTVPSRPI